MSDQKSALEDMVRLSRQGKYAEAEAAARTLLDQLPAAALTTFTLAHSVHQQGRLEEALSLYELALRYTPAHPSALNNSASILRQLGRHREALARYRQAVKAGPEEAWIWSNLSQALVELDYHEEALEALKRAAALAPDDTDVQDRLVAMMAMHRGAPGGKLQGEEADRRIWALNPAVRDFDRMGIALRPYVEHICQPNYRSETLNTDHHGFRLLQESDSGVDYDAFVASPGPKGILCGASQAFGYGIVDADTIQSRLSRESAGGARWFSLAVPASQLMQQRLLFELFAPAETRYCVVISGTVNVLLSFLEAQTRSPYPPLNNVNYEWPKASSAQSDAYDIDAAMIRTAKWMRENIEILMAKCRTFEDCPFLFCHPPVLVWTGKQASPEERELCEIYRQRHPTYASLVEDPSNRQKWRNYCADLKATVERAGGTYIEMSDEPALKSDESFFCDSLHPNAEGAKIMAECISRWASSTARPIFG